MTYGVASASSALPFFFVLHFPSFVNSAFASHRETGKPTSLSSRNTSLRTANWMERTAVENILEKIF